MRIRTEVTDIPCGKFLGLTPKIFCIAPVKDAQCEGDFEGDCSGDLEDFFDVVVGNPFAFTVLWAEITAASDVSLALLWGGSGSAHVAFDEDVDLQSNGVLSIVGTSTLTRFTVSGGGQFVPALGFLQWNTTDQITGGADPAPFHYKIHYTYRCADAP